MTSHEDKRERVIASLKRAEEVVFGLCQGNPWRMSIPVHKDDSDIVIAEALRDAIELLSEPRSATQRRTRTDAILTTPDGAAIVLHGPTISALADHARQLEIELAEAEAELERRQAKIMRLSSGAPSHEQRTELTGGGSASLNGWPGNQGTALAASEGKYRENSGAADSRERPAPSSTEPLKMEAGGGDLEILRMALGNTAACLGDALATFNKLVGQPVFKNSEPQSATAAWQWVGEERAKADAYEDAARICERMGEPGEGRERHRPGSDEEWASIKLEDAAKAIRERKARVCHVTQATTDGKAP